MTDENRQPVYTPPPAPGILPDGKRVFICTDHDLHWPVGGGSVIIADSEVQARGLLDAELTSRGLNASLPYTLTEVGQDGPVAVVISDGQY